MNWFHNDLVIFYYACLCQVLSLMHSCHVLVIPWSWWMHCICPSVIFLHLPLLNRDCLFKLLSSRISVAQLGKLISYLSFSSSKERRLRYLINLVCLILEGEAHLLAHIVLMTLGKHSLSEGSLESVRFRLLLLLLLLLDWVIRMSHLIYIFLSLLNLGSRNFSWYSQFLKRAWSVKLSASLEIDASLAIALPGIVLKEFGESLAVFGYVFIFFFVEYLHWFLHKMLGV